MAIDINDKSVFWGAVASNYYWGQMRGMEYKDTNFPGHICYAFKVKRGSNKNQNNSGPTGRKARKANRIYKNAKLFRIPRVSKVPKVSKASKA